MNAILWVWIPLLFVFLLLIACFFFKGPVMRIVIFLVLLSVMFRPEIKDTWLQAAVAVLMVWSFVSAFIKTKGVIGW